jgi:hypothetical protein
MLENSSYFEIYAVYHSPRSTPSPLQDGLGERRTRVFDVITIFVTHLKKKNMTNNTLIQEKVQIIPFDSPYSTFFFVLTIWFHRIPSFPLP